MGPARIGIVILALLPSVGGVGKAGRAAAKPAAPAPPAQDEYLPGPGASGELIVSTTGQPRRSIVVLTRADAIKETGPKETVRAFGEVYSFSPGTIVVRRDEPTEIVFWNLQPDDEHDFMLMDESWNVLMKVRLPPLKKTGFLFTFRRDGIYPFYCTMHPPEMAGQILVVPPPGKDRARSARPQEP